eukprot:6312858-Amphidinium_carterae.1
MVWRKGETHERICGGAGAAYNGRSCPQNKQKNRDTRHMTQCMSQMRTCCRGAARMHTWLAHSRAA